MKKIIIILILAVFTNVFSQVKNHNLFEINIQKTDNPSAQFRKSVDDGIIFNINKEEYKSVFSERENKINMRIPLKNGNYVNLNLEKFDILTPDVKFIEKSGNGEKEQDLRNIILSYKGKIEGTDNSLVSMTLYNNKVSGLMKSGKDTYVFGALKDENNNETDDYILYQESKLKNARKFICGSDIFDVPDDILRTMRDIYGKSRDMSTSNFLEARIAIDVDFFTYGVYGSSVANASAYALSLLSAASAVYVQDMNIKLTVGYLRVWTVQDPYTAVSGNSLLNQFQSEWITNQGSVERVIAHLVTRRTSIDVGGIAYLSALCNPTYGYGLSAVQGTINQLPAYSYDVVVVAHEIGHNFGSPHTHNCSWVGGPIDTCYIVEGGCYSGPSHPTVGTIMSYCDTEGGTVIMDFGTQPGNLIRSSAENAACINNYPRSVLTAYPNGGETFRTLSTGKIIWGTSLTGNVNLEYSSNNGNSWNLIQNNLPAQQREYNWTIPYIGYTNQAKVRVLNSSNLSEGDSSDAAFRILLSYIPFNVISPPGFTRIETSSNNISIQQFIWGSAGSHPSFRYKIKFRKIGSGAIDYTYSSDNSGADTVVSFRKSFLDSLAQTLGTSGDSVRCTWRSWAYNGYDSSAATNTFLVTFVRTNVGINIISSIVPEKFKLDHNYPNPFNPSTVIKFDVAEFQNVNITVYNMLGKEVRNLVNNKLQPGKYEVTFNASEFSSGIYYYKMQSGNFTATGKMLLVK